MTELSKDDKSTLLIIVGFAVGKGVCEYVNPNKIKVVVQKLSEEEESG